MTLTTVHTIFEPRPPRFVARAVCPSCKQTEIGITFHGVLLSGVKVFELAPHSPGRRAVKNKEGRCDGSQLRMSVTPEGWRPT